MPAGRIGIDTGGTFTDFVRLGPDGLTVHKVRSTPADPSRAILQGIQEIAANNLAAEDLVILSEDETAKAGEAGADRAQVGRPGIAG